MTRLLLSVTLVGLATTGLLAAAPSGLDAVPTGITPTAPMTIGDAPPAPAVALPPRGNPLWGLPLSVLTATRERPIFLPSRRPVAPMVATPQPVAPPPAAAPAPEQPRLTLVGAIVRDGDPDAIAIFLDQADGTVVRLRTGQKHGDWRLSSVKGRSATFEKGRETLVIELPAPGTAPTLPAAASGAGVMPVIPAATAAPPATGPTEAPPDRPTPGLVVPDPSVAAPFVPRSTPKNGESDGL